MEKEIYILNQLKRIKTDSKSRAEWIKKIANKYDLKTSIEAKNGYYIVKLK
jgi:hypothetical protein